MNDAGAPRYKCTPDGVIKRFGFNCFQQRIQRRHSLPQITSCRSSATAARLSVRSMSKCGVVMEMGGLWPWLLRILNLVEPVLGQLRTCIRVC